MTADRWLKCLKLTLFNSKSTYFHCAPRKSLRLQSSLSEISCNLVRLPAARPYAGRVSLVRSHKPNKPPCAASCTRVRQRPASRGISEGVTEWRVTVRCKRERRKDRKFKKQGYDRE
eukprot:6178044-Pleurochrysis_carterae.AAC.3